MGLRGVHFALTAEESSRLMDTPRMTDEMIMAFAEEIEGRWDKEWLQETDKAWDAIHRCLTDGTLLYVSGDYPLNHCICGGRQLYRGRGYTVSFVSARQVKDVAAALAKVTKAWMRRRYSRIDPEEYNEVEMGEEDFDSTWENFLDVRRFYKTAAGADRAVIFTVDC